MSLPYVPLPHTDEWLGFWLHRVAAAYEVNLGRLLAQTGDLAGAVAEFRQVLEIDPDDRDAKRELRALESRVTAAAAD